MTSLAKLQTMIDTTTHQINGQVYITTWQLLHQVVQPWPKIGLHDGPIAWSLFLPTNTFLPFEMATGLLAFCSCIIRSSIGM